MNFMKKILLSFTLACGIFASPIQAVELNDMAEMMTKELEQTSFAKGHSKTETRIIKYLTADDGSLMHFGIWSDCVIVTVVGNAPNIGLQGIFLHNGLQIDQSTNYTVKKDYFTHIYAWGKVTSWDHKQIVERK